MSLPLDYDKNISIERNYNTVENRITKTIYIGKVIENYDEKNLSRLKIRIDGIDNGVLDQNLIFSYPFLPVFNYILPKKGELVRVILSDVAKPFLDGNRFWVGPLIGNFSTINDYKYYLSDNPDITDVNIAGISVNNRNNEKNVFPTGDTETYILGRNNSDVILGDNKIIIRSGKHLINKPNEVNNINPAFYKAEINQNYSYNLISSDKIFLNTYNGRLKFGIINNLNDIENDFQSSLYGELTIDYLKTLTNAFLEHYHPHPQAKPVDTTLIKTLSDKLAKIEELLAKNIKIN
jgi:hypothetical protein